MLAKKLKVSLSAVGEDTLMAEPLTIAALTKYFRAFGEGKRPKLEPAEVAALPETLLLAHRRYLAIRNKHIAHAANRYESHQVTLAVADLSTSTARATAVSSNTTSIVSLSGQEADELSVLCDYWLEKLNTEKATETAKLLEIAQRLTPAELNALPPVPDAIDEDPFREREFVGTKERRKAQ